MRWRAKSRPRSSAVWLAALSAPLVGLAVVAATSAKFTAYKQVVQPSYANHPV